MPAILEPCRNENKWGSNIISGDEIAAQEGEPDEKIVDSGFFFDENLLPMKASERFAKSNDVRTLIRIRNEAELTLAGQSSLQQLGNRLVLRSQIEARFLPSL